MNNSLLKTIGLFVLPLLLLTESYSQTAQEIAKIKEKTNVEKLRAMSERLSANYHENKSLALQLAKKHGWVIRKEFDGGVYELQGVTDDGRPRYYITHNADAAETVSADQVYSGGGAGLSLDGTGMTAAEWDAGDVLTSHHEFNNTGFSRVNDCDGINGTHYHSTHVAGTIMGGGVVSQAKGMAYNASLDAYDWDYDNSEMAAAGAGGALISTHSYGYITGWYWNGSNWEWWGDWANAEDVGFGYYGTDCQAWDQIAVDAPYYLICKSSGNDRGDGPTGLFHPPDGGAEGYDCIGWRGNAKNILTVGAVKDVNGGYTGDPDDVEMTTFSSWGPCDDGRIKPDIVGNGYSLYSPINNHDSSYYSLSGTSMATPNVSGSLLLLQEHYNETHSSYMKAATLKALAIHTADECGPDEGPDYMFGWGLLNTAKAADVITDNTDSAQIIEESLSDGSPYSLQVAAPGTEPLIATIVWTDPPGTPPAGSTPDPTDTLLVNDLDLTVTEATAKTTYYPYMLDGQNPSNAATKGDNDVDNVEKIYISSPTPGMYTIQITNEGALTDGPQDFSLIVSGIENVCLPTVNTTTVTAIGSDTAVSGGNVTNDGGTSITARGVCWSTSSDPDLSDNFTVDGSGTGSFTSIITGLAPNTTCHVRAYATNWAGTGYGDDKTFTTKYGALAWNGMTDTVWNKTTNWENNTLPTADYNVTIPNGMSNYPTIAAAQTATCNKLTIETAASLTCQGSLTHNDSLIIQSDAAGTGSLLISGTITSNGTVRIGRYINNNNSWHLLSSPVAAQAIQPGFVPSGGSLPSDFDFYYFDETATNGYPWINVRGTGGNLNGSFETQFNVGKGYLVAYTGTYSTSKVFEGATNTGAKSLTLSYTSTGGEGWNLSGNPYTASIDWSTVNKSPLTDNYFYAYDNTANSGAGDYVYSNGTTGTTSPYIAPMQGFFVNVPSAGSLNLSAANLNHSSQDFLKDSFENREMLEVKLFGPTFS